MPFLQLLCQPLTLWLTEKIADLDSISTEVYS